jgi:hypothetical protein
MTETTPESHESDTLFLGVTKEKVGEIVVSTVATAIAGLVIAVAKGRIDAALPQGLSILPYLNIEQRI